LADTFPSDNVDEAPFNFCGARSLHSRTRQRDRPAAGGQTRDRDPRGVFAATDRSLTPDPNRQVAPENRRDNASGV
jgi:hypothetical protein